MHIPNHTFHNDVEIPAIGLGVWKAEQGSEVQQAIAWALEAGYRSIDTAAIYGNEQGVGKALQASEIPRDEIFVTSKLWNEDMRKGRAEAAFEETMQKLQLEVLDLYLIHWPVEGHFVKAWQALETLYEAGKVRAIGVSNFMPEHLETLLKTARIKPMINQIEHHPYLQQRKTVDFCRQHQIVVEAWSPLMQGNLNQETMITELAEKYHKSPAQVILRWAIQKDLVVIPKSTNEGRIQENFAIFDFELSSGDLDRLDALERNQRFGPDPYTFGF